MEFMRYLKFMPHQTCIVAGHSLFFRRIFKKFIGKEEARARARSSDPASLSCAGCVLRRGVATVGAKPTH